MRIACYQLARKNWTVQTATGKTAVKFYTFYIFKKREAGIQPKNVYANTLSIRCKRINRVNPHRGQRVNKVLQYGLIGRYVIADSK